MRTGYLATHPQVEKLVIEGYRRMTPAQKVALVGDLNRFAQSLQLAQIQARYPEADERELTLRLASRHLPADLMRQAFTWDPEKAQPQD